MCFDGWKGEGMKREPIDRSFQQSANTQKPFNGFEMKVAGTELLPGKLLNLLDLNPKNIPEDTHETRPETTDILDTPCPLPDILCFPHRPFYRGNDKFHLGNLGIGR